MTYFKCAISVAMLASPCAAEVVHIAPVFTQIVAFTAPTGFQAGEDTVNGPHYMHETVPQGETLTNWTQMMTLTGNQNRAQGDVAEAAVAFAKQMAGGYRAACPDSFTAEQLTAPRVAGARGSFAFYVGCGTVDGKNYSESMLALVMVGTQDLYTLQWAERQPAGPKPVFDPAHWLPRLDFMGTGTKVCDNLGEPAPYPSCLQ